MTREEIRFYPEHPSLEKTELIATVDSPLLPQQAPVDSAALYSQFAENFDAALETFLDKRFEVSGIAVKVGPDGHQKPSVQLSDSIGGRCHVLCVFPSEEVYEMVRPGDRVTVRGNYLVLCNYFGIVLKKCEVVTG